jgi:hypothetical protein
MLLRIVVATVVLLVSWVSAFPALADDFANHAAALEVIKKAAADICHTVPQNGSSSR